MDCLFRVKTITLETTNVTNCHVIATDILFLSSNHRSVQFLYLAASEDADGLIEDNQINVIGRILEAVQFAAIKHKDQRRKDPEETPYINHPIGVAYILWKEGGIHDSRVLQVSLRPNRLLDMILCKVSYLAHSNLLILTFLDRKTF